MADNLNREAQAIWDKNATFWDQKMGEGNQFQRVLVGPSAERLLAIQPGDQILEIACGNGVFARRMAQLGAQVLATDFSPTFIEKARQRSQEYGSRIEYQVLDATDRDAIRALGSERFDKVVCNMALMDMVEIEPLFQSLPELLKPGGSFVFTMMHPSFNNSYCSHLAEREDREGKLVTTYAVKVTGYSYPRTSRGLGIIGQPEPHYYFHRPLSQILTIAFCSGFVMDGMEEPFFELPEDPAHPLSWDNFKGIPPVMSVRLKKL